MNVIEALGFARPHLVGMSLGGVAAAYACLAARSFTPARLTLVDVAPGVDFSASARLREFIGGGAVEGGVQGLLTEARRIGARGDDAVLFYRYSTLIRQDETGAWRWKRDGRRPPDYSEILSSLEALGEHAPGFAWPVLLVRGAESRILGDTAAAEFVSRCPDGRLVVVEGAGHTVQEDNPRALAQALFAFWS